MSILRKLIFILGIGITMLFVAYGFLFYPHQRQYRIDRTPLVFEDYGPGTNSLAFEFVNPQPFVVRVHVTAPETLRTDDSATVTAVVEFEKPRSDALQFTFSLLLTGAGLEVEPKDWLMLLPSSPSGQATALWSIRTSNPGYYHLILNPKLETRIGGAKKNTPYTSPHFGVLFAPNADLTLVVKSKWSDYVGKAWPFIAAFMGSLLTLPGIISFYKDRKQNRHEATGSGRT